MKNKMWLVPVLILALFALASCGDDDEGTTVTETEPAATAPNPEDESSPAETTPAPAGSLERSVKVEIVDFAYDPDPARVATGGKVIWQNRDSAPHTATADDNSFDTGTLEEGKLKSETFKQAGTFTYFCEIHPDMRGTVEVIDAE
jgi:plastocyanin